MRSLFNRICKGVGESLVFRTMGLMILCMGLLVGFLLLVHRLGF